MLKHGSVVRPTMYLTSMDIKTACSTRQDRDVSRKLWKANPWMDNCGPFARDVGVRGTGDVRMRGEQILIQSMCPSRKRRRSQIVTMDGHAAPSKGGGKLEEGKAWVSSWTSKGKRAHQTCSFMWTDVFRITSHSKGNL